MTHIKAFALVLCLTILATPALAWEAIVTSIKDGDSFIVQRTDTGQNVEIRLWGIDCPERNQRFGYAATQFGIEALLDQRVGIMEMYQDVYDRTVGATIILENGEVYQDLLMRAGLAWVDPRFCPDCRSWEAMQEGARLAGIGLWQDENPVPPWDWRRGVR